MRTLLVMAIRWQQVRALTFDCYGTLVDWETGLAADLAAGLATSLNASSEQCLEWYGDAEARIEAGPFLPYKEVLRRALICVGEKAGTPIRDPEALVRGLPRWPLFVDTTNALTKLQQRFRLCICSNVDRDLFSETERAIGIRFDEVVTADEVRSYKPATAHWREALRRLQLQPSEVVHIAQSLYHDIGVASSLGIATVWVDRRQGRSGGATPITTIEPRPALTVTSLSDLVALIESELVPGTEGNLR